MILRLSCPETLRAVMRNDNLQSIGHVYLEIKSGMSAESYPELYAARYGHQIPTAPEYLRRMH